MNFLISAVRARVIAPCLACFCLIAQAGQNYVAEVTVGFHSDREIDVLENSDNFESTIKDAIVKTVRSIKRPGGDLAWKTGGDKLSFDRPNKSLIIRVHGTDPILTMQYANTYAAHLLSNFDAKHNVQSYIKAPCSPWGPSMGAIPLIEKEPSVEHDRGPGLTRKNTVTNRVERTVGDTPEIDSESPKPQP